MSTDPMSTEEGPDVGPLEYVLALEAADARRRFELALLDDPGLAATVWATEERLRPLADVVAPRKVRPRNYALIEARLFGREAAATRALRTAARFWRQLAALLGVAAGVATALAVVLAVRPELVRPEEPMWIAAIVRNDGEIALARLRTDGRLVAQPFPHDDTGSAELWLVQESAPPIGLGLLGAAAGTELLIPSEVRRAFAGGAQLVITLEPEGGSPTGAPTGPHLGVGPLSRI